MPERRHNRTLTLQLHVAAITLVLFIFVFLVGGCSQSSSSTDGGRLSNNGGFTGSGSGGGGSSSNEPSTSGSTTGGSSSSSTPKLYSIGGSIQGLNGTIVLQNNGGDDLTLTANGIFTFSEKLVDGMAYDVTIASTPATQTCIVANSTTQGGGTGVVSGANVASIVVACTAVGSSLFSVGGSVNDFTSTIKLKNGSDEITVEPPTLTTSQAFVFPTLLSLGQSYAVTVSQQPRRETCTVINGSSPSILANVADIVVSCNPIPRRWREPANLDDSISIQSGKDATLPVVAINDNDDAMVVWTQTDEATFPNNGYQVFMSELIDHTWTHPQAFTEAFAPQLGPNPGIAYSPAVAMSDNGDAVVAWGQILDLNPSSATRSNIFMREKRGGAWTLAPSTASQGVALASGFYYNWLSAAMSDAGEAIVAWHGTNSAITPTRNAYRLEYNPSIPGWSTRPAPPINVTNNAGTPLARMANNGEAVVIWGTIPSAATPYSTPLLTEKRGGSWSPALGLSFGIQPVSKPNVDISNNGTIAGWCEETSAGSGRWHVRIIERRGGPLLALEATSYVISPAESLYCSSPVIAINDNGDALVAWVQNFTGGNEEKIFVSTYDSASGLWTHPSSVNAHINLNPAGGFPSNLSVDFGNNGTAVVVYGQDDSGGESSIFKSIFNGGTWDHPDNADDDISPEGKDADFPVVAVNNNGNIIIAWRQGDYTTEHRIYISEYR